MLLMFLIEVAPDRFGVYSAGVSVIAGCVVELDMLFFGHVCRTSIPSLSSKCHFESTNWLCASFAMERGTGGNVNVGL